MSSKLKFDRDHLRRVTDRLARNEDDLTVANQRLTALADVNDVLGTGMKRSAIQLKESELRFRQLTENIAEVFFLIDAASMQILYVSPAYEAVWGASCASLYDAPLSWSDAIPLEERTRVLGEFARALPTGRFEFEYPIVREDGALREIRARGFPIRDSDGRVYRIAAIAEDITERHVAEDEVRRLNAELERRVADRTAELEAANRELEAFDYSISHDLRAPLNRIDGFSAMLAEQYGDRLDVRGRDLLMRIAEAGRSMDQLVGDLFKLSTVTRGELRRTAIDVSAVAESIVAALRKADPQREVRFDVPAGMRARSDPGLLRVVLENLLGNAWKFTRNRAQAAIEMGCLENLGERVFFVRDNGAGFDVARADKLFAPFQRLHSGSDFEGTGIGLATVQRIIRRHGGRVWAEAAVDGGATFFFTLSA